VQSFIRSSRKLRDLYGSSLLLSHLAHALYLDATTVLGHPGAVVSPAGVSISRGVPNTLVIAGAYSKAQAREALQQAWKQVLSACRTWLEKRINPASFSPPPTGWSGNWEQGWGASWKALASHSWEVFHGQGPTISAARQALRISKQARDWSLPNWTGESSSLSSFDAMVRPTMGMVIDPRRLDHDAARQEARDLLQQLRDNLGDAFAGEKEEISLPELVKRLITYKPILQQAFRLAGAAPDVEELLQKEFPLLSTRASDPATPDPDLQKERPESIIWFMADGDRIGSHLDRLAARAQVPAAGNEEQALRQFSLNIRAWASSLYTRVPALMGEASFARDERRATVVYAGGDDLLGALHESRPGSRDLKAHHLWSWLVQFPSLWQEAGLPEVITVSMGLVWATASVPQREALQHARDAETSAKARGRDRFALRLLYASGNHLEWSCPWRWLSPIREHYRDREGRQGAAASWRHLAEDLVWLQERQSLPGTARGLWEAYFPGCDLPLRSPPGAIGEGSFVPSLEAPEQHRRFDQWLLDLGLVMAGLEKRSEATAVGVAA
jgi:CRISPR-associated protein Cmr2